MGLKERVIAKNAQSLQTKNKPRPSLRLRKSTWPKPVQIFTINCFIQSHCVKEWIGS